MRRWLLIVGGVLAALLLVAVVLVFWALRSEPGRDFALARAQAFLPGELHYSRAEGTVAGPLTLHDVHWVGDDGLEVHAARVHLDHSIRGLFGRRVDIALLELDGVDVILPPPAADVAGEPFELPAELPWPDVDLPVDVHVARLVVRGARMHRDGDVLLDVAGAEAAFDWPRGGRLDLHRLDIDAAQGRLAARGWLGMAGEPAAELDARIQLDGAADAIDLRLADRDDGVTAHIGLAAAGSARIDLDRDFRWRLETDLRNLRRDRLMPEASPEPLDIRLIAHGDRTAAALEGTIGVDGRRIDIEPSAARIDFDAQQITLEPLQIVLDDGGRLTAEGRIDLQDPLQLDLVARLDGVRLPIGDDDDEDAAPDIARFDGQLQARGPLDALALSLDGRLQRGELAADVAVIGELGEDRFALERFEIAHGTGRVLGRGRVDWREQPAWDIEAEFRDFDPGVIAEDFAGRVQGSLVTRGRITDEGPDLELDLQQLTGTFRGQPLHAHGRVQYSPQAADADLTARIGDSRLHVRGVPTEDLDLVVDVERLALADVMPDAAGVVRGQLRIRGLGDDARIEGALDLEDLRLEEHRIARGRVEIDAPLDFARDGRVRLTAADATLAGEQIDRIALDVTGGLEDLDVQIDAEGPRLAIDGAWRGRQVDDGWAGELQRLRLRSGDMPTLELEGPAELAFGEFGLALGENCIRAEQGRVCWSMQVRNGEQQLQLTIDALPLALLEPWIADAEQPLSVAGTLDGSGSLRIVDGTPRDGRVQLSSAAGEIGWQQADAPQTLLQWSALSIDARLEGGQLAADVEASIDGEGRLVGRVSGGSPFESMDAPMTGRIDVELPQLRLLSLLPDTVVSPDGRLQAGLDLGGQWNAPAFDGRIELAGFTAEVPVLGITIVDTRVTLSGGLQRLDIDGEMRSGDGLLRMEGAIEGIGGDDPLAVRVRVVGSDVTVVDTPLVRAIASPNLTADYVDERLRIGGELVIPTARLQLDRIDNTVGPSADVVVLDPEPGREQPTQLPIFADVRITLGDDVVLEGYGFDGGISGTINVRERPDRPTTARGSLEVRGEYTAYGQDLAIQRGRLMWASTPIENPSLDLRVSRTIGEIEAGLDITGPVDDPTVRVWSTPEMEEGEALAYLLLGRPLRAAGAGDSEELTQAALAMGGNLLAAQLGARLGFDTFEVGRVDTLGTALTIGRYLSPRLHVSYGIALFGTGHVISLRYLLTERFEIELETGEESRAAINFRVER